MNKRSGYRGYIGCRPIFGNRVPQNIQNLVIRDHCQRRGLSFQLSAVEYAMPGCFAILEDVVAEMPKRQGMVCYSLFMLPGATDRRLDVCRRILAVGAEIHCAVEDLCLASESDLERAEDLWRLQQFSALYGLTRPIYR